MRLGGGRGEDERDGGDRTLKEFDFSDLVLATDYTC